MSKEKCGRVETFRYKRIVHRLYRPRKVSIVLKVQKGDLGLFERVTKRLMIFFTDSKALMSFNTRFSNFMSNSFSMLMKLSPNNGPRTPLMSLGFLE